MIQFVLTQKLFMTAFLHLFIQIEFLKESCDLWGISHSFWLPFFNSILQQFYFSSFKANSSILMRLTKF